MAAMHGSVGRVAEDVETETMEITDEDAAFILGKGGKTKMKIAKVSECQIELLDEELTLEFTGTPKQRAKAMRYVRCVVAQRTGAVILADDDLAEDCTVLTIPQPAIGFVTGKAGNFLRTLEDEHSTIMCFAQREGAEPSEETSDLMIFGDRPARRAAQLAVMSVVETKVPGYYTEPWKESGTTFEVKADLVGDWGTSTMELTQDELSYAIGPQGRTRKKLARAAQCVLQYVGSIVFMSGSRKTRERAKEYLKWLLEQLNGPIFVDVRGRDDASVIDVPVDCVGYVTGKGRETMSMVEETCGAMMLFMKRPNEDAATEKLAIFGSLRARRSAELMVMSAVERKNPGHYTSTMTDKKCTTRGFDVDRLGMDPEDMAYALGKEGTTRNKIALASNAVLQFVNTMAFIGGDVHERQRCRDYLGWLLEQKDGKVQMDVRERTDVTEMDLTDDDVGYLLGPDGLPKMREIEQECHCFCIMTEAGDDGASQLLICGHEEGTAYSATGRQKAKKLLARLVHDQPRGWKGRGGGGGGKGGGGKGGGGKGGWSGGWDARSRSPRNTRYSSGGGWQGGGGGGGGYKSSGASYSSGAIVGGGSWSGGGGAKSWQQRDSSWGADRGRQPAQRGSAGRSPTPPWRKSSKPAGGNSRW